MPVMHIADAISKVLSDWSSAMFPAFARAAAPAAVAALWQGALVAFALALCLRLAPRVSAAHRFLLWAAGFAVVVGLPLLPLFGHSSGASAVAPIPEAAGKPWLNLDIRWAFIIAAAWLAASAFRAGELAFHALRLRRLWKAAVPVEVGVEIGVEIGADINSRFKSPVRGTLAVVSDSRRVEICTTRDLDCPSVIGFFAPRILIPEWLFSRLTPGELEQVVLHEAEHLRRHDDWTNLLQKLALVLFPLNPALAWMERRLCREREIACDEGVVRRTQAPRAYAACLTRLAEGGLQQRELLRRAHALSLGAFTKRPELVHRVHSILRRKQALNPLVAAALVGIVGFGLVIGAMELSRSPQLVAFVAAPEVDAQVAALAPRSGLEGVKATDSVFHPAQRAQTPRIHAIETQAIETKAIMSASRDEAMASIAARPVHGGETATTDAAAAPVEVPVKAVAPISKMSDGQVQEFLVLTTWEAVQTSSPDSRTIADYETGASGRNDAGTSQPDAARNAQITVTRMILVFYPAGAYPASVVRGARPAPTTGSPSHRPAPSYGGWLFFQL
jgi:bla regulator protein blaR1